MVDIFFNGSWFYANIDEIIDLSIEKVGTTNEGANIISPCDDTAKSSTEHIE